MKRRLLLALTIILSASSLVLAQNSRVMLEITPSPSPATPLVVKVGETVQFFAKAYEFTSNGQRQEVQITQLSWDVTPPAFGTIDASGLLTVATQNPAPRGEIIATAAIGNMTVRASVIALLAPPQHEYTFSGTVRSASGPIEHAQVSVMGAGMLPFMVDGKTDAQGNFSIDVPAGDYIVRAAAAGYLPEYFDDVLTPDKATTFTTDPANKVIDNIDFVLGEGGKIRGTVYSVDKNTPLPDATVFARPAATNTRPPSNAGFAGRTDANGDFEITGLPDDDYIVMAEARDHMPLFFDGKNDATGADAVTIASSATIDDVDFVLQKRQQDPVFTISGTVSDAQQVPIAGANVFAEMYNGPMLHWLQARTQQDGSYELHVPSGTFVVWAVAQGFATEYYDNAPDAQQADKLTLDASNPTETGIDFTLGTGGIISGIVRDAVSGNPVEGAAVTVHGDRNTNPSGSTNGAFARTDANGAYRITGLATGSYFVLADNDGYARQYYDGAVDLTNATPVAVTDGQETQHIDFDLDKFGGSIAGVVRDDNGAPVADANVIAWANVQPNAGRINSGYGHAISAQDGSYMIDGLPQGDYYVRATAKGFIPQYFDNASDMSSATKVAVTNQALTGIDFSLGKGGSISGAVKDEESGDPLPYAVVLVRGTNQQYEHGARTDANGQYTIEGLADDDYIVFATAPRFLGEFYDDVTSPKQATAVTVTSSADVTGIDFELAAAPVGPRSYQGRVVARSGGAPSIVLVEAIHPATGQRISTTTDSQGAFGFSVWEDAIIRARALGYIGSYAGNTRDWKQSMWNGFSDEITIALDPIDASGMAEVRGRITDVRSGDGLPNAWVYGVDAAGKVFFTVTDPDGNYLMEQTSNGSLDIMVSEVGYENAHGQVSIEDARGMTNFSLTPTSVTGVENAPALPATVTLMQNYPNPFNPSTTMRFALPERMHITLRVFDLLGRDVAIVAEGTYDAGSHSVVFHASSLPSGIYLYQLEANGTRMTRRMTLMK
ncbi:MAG: carboxypeptidase regulatory-like domain-containing protein [Bacteroidetes bacterium]|nr:carboxypeptidase regulatory-like domain-containing protein [Bacteroidota bacterium]